MRIQGKFNEKTIQTMNKENSCKFLDGDKCMKAMFRYSLVRDYEQLAEKMQEYIPFADITPIDVKEDHYDVRFDFVGIQAKNIDLRFDLEPRVTENNGREFKLYLIKDISIIN